MGGVSSGDTHPCKVDDAKRFLLMSVLTRVGTGTCFRRLRSWVGSAFGVSPVLTYRGTYHIRNSAPLGRYSRTMSRAPRRSWGGALFLMSEVPVCFASGTSAPACFAQPLWGLLQGPRIETSISLGATNPQPYFRRPSTVDVTRKT